MKRLDQRILLAATVLFAAVVAVLNSNLPATILAVACLGAWNVITYRSMSS